MRHQSIDAAMAILTIHHWDREQERGVRELRRVARGPVVILTYDWQISNQTWLTADYLPEVANMDRRIFPSLDTLAGWLGGHTVVETVAVSRDTPDWTFGSFWAHPERVLDSDARNATSGFARLEPQVVQQAVRAVEHDLQTGRWEQRHGHLRQRQTLDVGLRLLVNKPR